MMGTKLSIPEILLNTQDFIRLSSEGVAHLRDLRETVMQDVSLLHAIFYKMLWVHMNVYPESLPLSLWHGFVYDVMGMCMPYLGFHVTIHYTVSLVSLPSS
jgi:hypothetical protein